MFMILIGIFFALFMIANGSLLLFWPKYFLRFYDFWSHGDYVGRAARWRSSVGKIGYRLLGLGASFAGVLMLWNLIRTGWSR
jgi:hypothetical protein